MGDRRAAAALGAARRPSGVPDPGRSGAAGALRPDGSSDFRTPPGDGRHYRRGARGQARTASDGGADEGVGVPRTRQQGVGGRPGRDGPRPHGRRRQGGDHDDLRHRSAHPAGRRRRRDRRSHPRPRGGRHDHGGRRRGERVRRGRPRAGPGDHQVRAVRVLPARHAFALPDRRRHRLDLRPPHRRHAGRARPGALRRHVALRHPRGRQRRAGDLPRRLAAHRVRGRRARGRRAARRHGRGRRRGSGRPLRDPHDGPVGRVEGDRGRHEQVPPHEGDRVRRHRRRRGRTGHRGRRDRADRRPRRGRRPSRPSATRRRCSPRRRWSGRAARSPTSACTAPPWSCRCRTCGSRTSR